ncbi:MAG TPA: chaperonin GroEL [Planctomycetes bacterium]|nr:chaperonin GroEL [Planctomycetota bacterium]
MAKQILFDDQARTKLQAGIRTLSKTVGVTLGPAGRNVILEKSFGGPQVTKDGVTVAKEIEVKDPFENMGAKLVRQVASKTNDEAGDGTTTATLLAAEMVDLGLRHMASGASPTALRKGMEIGAEAALACLQTLSKPVSGREDIVKVGTISSNQDAPMGELFADAVEKAGEQGVITVEEAQGIETTLEYVDGMAIDKGYISPYFVTDLSKMTAEYEDALVLVHEKKISSLAEFLPVLEQAAQSGKPLLIIAEDIEGEALAALVVNKLRAVMKVVAIKAPGFGDRRKAMLGDIAALTGATAIMEETGLKLESVSLEHLGQVRKVSIEKDRTVLVDGGGEKNAIEERTRQIEAQMKKSTSDYDKEKLQERLAKLAGGVAVIQVGGATEAEMKERKDRAEDALHATRAAIEEGVVPGGGTAMLRCIQSVEAVEADGDENLGVALVAQALRAPARAIASNAGYDGSVTVAETLESEGWNGFDALKGNHCDLAEAGVIDPTKVVRLAIQNSTSVASLLLTTNTLVTELKEEEDQATEGAVA